MSASEKSIARRIITSENIETTLENCFGSVLRWAIVDKNNNGIKVSFTYEKDI